MIEAAEARVSVLVPVGKKDGSVADVHRTLVDKLDGAGRLAEVIFLVARSSTSIAALRELRAADPDCVRVLQFEYAVGEAAMLRAGAEVASGDLLLTMPCPPEVDADAIDELCARVDDGADLVVATRTASLSGRSASVQSRIFNRIISLAAGMRVRDVASGTRLMRREVLKEIPLYGDFHRYLPILAERTGYRVEEVPVAQHATAHRAAVHAPSTYLWRLIDVLTVLFISRFTRKPLRLFGSFGVAFLAAGLSILAVVGVDRLLGTPLGGRPILVLGTLLVGLGVQSFTIGLLGELLLFFNASSFRDYRVSEVLESESPLPDQEPTSAVTAAPEAPLPAPPATPLPRISGTRSPG